MYLWGLAVGWEQISSFVGVDVNIPVTTDPYGVRRHSATIKLLGVSIV